ncbi:unnamed protein product [Brachionus calyciflorus]|uniref:Acyl-coenzyme A oxidase n=1 Tax=Brachionus calyciflorus TaxID=104777 RepID=A0A814DS60_9BILA|nr:unnamed protein product [Brachionus calyciflorus]
MVNPDLVKERQNSTLDVDKLNLFFGQNLLLSTERYKHILNLKKRLTNQIKSLYDENYENLERNDKYELVLRKSIELIEFGLENNIDNYLEYTYIIGEVMGTEKQIFGLHFTMFSISLDLWSTPEQKTHWANFMKQNGIFGTYIQTEIGHGTYLRGLETTATYDSQTQEFILDSPTLTSIKFWPGASGKTCNYAIVMAKLIIDNKEHGIHAFVVQLRSLENHRPVPGIELGDIGKKHAYEGIDNGFVKFNKVRIPRDNMLMRFAHVSPNGEFKRTGNEVVMYACMLIMRGILCMFASLLHSISTTIAIRYSCVRRQTADPSGIEPQIIEYQTQQYRLLPGLATSYTNFFATVNFRNILNEFKKSSENFLKIDSNEIAKLHAISSGLKAIVFEDCLKFAQLNRLCCGGHGYSASSGLQPVIQEADAGCTYEGDNTVLYLQTARYLLKSAQKGFSPHLLPQNFQETKDSKVFVRFEKYTSLFEKLFEAKLREVSERMFYLIEEKNMNQYDAWNNSSLLLVETARIYVSVFVIYTNLKSLNDHSKMECNQNQIVLEELFELYLLYGIVEKFSIHFLKLELIDGTRMTDLQTKFFELLKKVRVNALCLVDAFGWSDSNLASSLGVYDGNVYEKLFDYAKNSLFNKNDVHKVYDKLVKPYVETKAKL